MLGWDGLFLLLDLAPEVTSCSHLVALTGSKLDLGACMRSHVDVTKKGYI